MVIFVKYISSRTGVFINFYIEIIIIFLLKVRWEVVVFWLMVRKGAKSIRSRLLGGTVSAAALCHCGIAVAQSAPAAQEVIDQRADSFGIADIVVTAQRREQRLQDVPVAVTAVSGVSMEANRVQTVVDLTGIVPGLLTRTTSGGFGTPSLAMRGISSTSSATSQDREISQYLDGVYIGGTRGVIFDIADLERIEVLRGPQGTLFGRNATAGAISLVTRDPTGEFGFRQDLTYGNQGHIRTRTTFNTPQFGPFSGYITYVHDERRGDVRNLGYRTIVDRSSGFQNFAGRQSSPKYLGGKNVESVFAALRFVPSDSLKATYKFDHTSGWSVQDVRTITALNTASPVGALIAGILANQPAGGGRFGPSEGLNTRDRRPDAANNGWTQKGFIRSEGHNLTTEWQASDSLVVKNISAYRKGSSYGPGTIAGLNGLEFTPAVQAFVTTPQPSLGGASYAQALGLGSPALGSFFSSYDGSYYGKVSQYSTEFQGNFTSDFMDLTVGALYYRSKEFAGSVPGIRANFAFTFVPQPLPIGTNILDAGAKTKSLAGYAQADIHLTPQLDLQIGGRVTNDKKRTRYAQGGVLVGDRETGTITGLNNIPGRFKTTKATYSVGLNYKPNTDTLIYAKHSTGFLSGGSVGTLLFSPEEVTSFEGGLKTDLLDRRLRVNAAVWHATYKHLQQSNSGITLGFPQLGVVVIDAGMQKAKGAELEITAQPVDGLTFGGQVGYTDTKLTNINPILLLTQTRYKNAGIPKWVGGVNAQYISEPLFDEATALIRIDGNYQGKSRAISNPDIATAIPAFAPYEYSPSRWIVNARVALRDIPMAKAKAEVALWARNLTNDRSPSFGFPFGTILYSDSYQRARTYGLEFSVKY